MLPQQGQTQFGTFSGLYDLTVPKGNPFRQINELMGFTFVYKEPVNKYLPNNGRTAESPVRMFEYLLLKTMYTASNVDAVERPQYDMSFKYSLEMPPQEGAANPSPLTEFRKLRLKDAGLLNLSIGKTVSIAIEKGIIKPKPIIVDATRPLSRPNPYSALEALRARSKLPRKAAYAVDEDMKGRMPEKNGSNGLEKELVYCRELEKKVEPDQASSQVPAVKEKLNLLKGTMEDTQENHTPSKDRGAKTGHKSADGPFFGYKAHPAATEERIVTAAVVTSGEKGDGPGVPETFGDQPGQRDRGGHGHRRSGLSREGKSRADG